LLCNEDNLEQYFTLDALTARLRGVNRTRLENDFDRLQGRRFLSPLRSRATAGCDCVAEPASYHDATITASMRARSNHCIAESGCAYGAADAMGSARAIAFARSGGQVEGPETGNDDIVAFGIALSGYAVGIAEAACLNFTRWSTHSCYFRFRCFENVGFDLYWWRGLRGRWKWSGYGDFRELRLRRLDLRRLYARDRWRRELGHLRWNWNAARRQMMLHRRRDGSDRGEINRNVMIARYRLDRHRVSKARAYRDQQRHSDGINS